MKQEWSVNRFDELKDSIRVEFTDGSAVWVEAASITKSSSKCMSIKFINDLIGELKSEVVHER